VGVSNITSGIGTFTDLRVGGDSSFSEDLVVTGNARVTGILTVGTSSIILNDSANTIKVGTALTLGHTQGLQFHTQNLHSTGFEVNQINASGIITATGADINGDIDVDGHTNLDNVNIAGVTTFAQGISVSGSVSSGSLSIGAVAPTIYLNDTDANSDFTIQVNSGLFKIMDSTNSYATRLSINSSGNVSIAKDLDVDGHTNLDNVSM
ncbi:MAG: hypothetical protein VXY93_18400, partial [Pseudomonadota bacterium]|nr:hypothetical protein [Pseudomonadota bacterium]